MFIYVASPYSHHDPYVRNARAQAARRYARDLFISNIPCYSPIAHWEPIAREFGLPHDIEHFWTQDEPLLRQASIVHVLKLPEWDVSIGIARELRLSNELGKPVEFIDYPL